MNKKYTTVFIDFDDTLIDTYGNAKICMHEVYEEHNIQKYYATFEDFFEVYQTNNSKLWSDYSKGLVDKQTILDTRFVKPFENFPDVDSKFMQQLSTDFLSKVVLKGTHIEGAMELLDYLKPKYKIVMLSNGFSELQYKKVESAGFTEYFDEIILSDVVGVNKPHPDIFTYALNKAQAQANEVIMIGDNLAADIEGSRNSNIDQIWYNPNKKAADFIPTHTVKRLSEIIDIL